MGISNAQSTWTGSLKTGKGVMHPANGPEVAFTLGTRFEGVKGSNPEEMLGAAFTGCFSMALAAALGGAGIEPASITTTAKVHLDKDGPGFKIGKIELRTEIHAPNADASKVKAIAEQTHKQCPVGKALSSVEITVEAVVAE